MMAFGCLASLVLYAVLAAFLIPNGLVLLATAVLIVGTVLLVNRWLHSDWPLY